MGPVLSGNVPCGAIHEIDPIGTATGPEGGKAAKGGSYRTAIGAESFLY